MGQAKIACMVTNDTTTDTCGNPGPGSAQHIPIYTPPANYANFNAPFLDLADVTRAQTPEPGTWALTVPGVGGACIAARMRRRSSSAAALKRVLEG